VPVRGAAPARERVARRFSTAAISSISDAVLFDLPNGTPLLSYQ